MKGAWRDRGFVVPTVAPRPWDADPRRVDVLGDAGGRVLRGGRVGLVVVALAAVIGAVVGGLLAMYAVPVPVPGPDGVIA